MIDLVGNDMKVLVTGASGFVGGYLLEELALKGHIVTGMVRKNSDRSFLEELGVKLVVGDLTDPDSLMNATKGVDAVVHLAAHYTFSGKKEVYERVNVEGTRSLLEASLKNHILRFVYCSTTEVIGPVENPPGDENSPLNPQYDYGRSKVKAEGIVKEYASKGLDYTIVRPSGIYGPRNVDDVSYWFITSVLKNSISTRFIVGSGENLVQFTHISDIVQGFALMLEKLEISKNQVYIVSEDGAHTYNEAYKILCDISGRKTPWIHVPPLLAKVMITPVEGINRVTGRENFMWHIKTVDSVTTNRWYSIEKAKKELGFAPKYNLKTGLVETVNWYIQKGYL
jgi:nucleoside-diphosphate-sugar epimerase